MWALLTSPDPSPIVFVHIQKTGQGLDPKKPRITPFGKKASPTPSYPLEIQVLEGPHFAASTVFRCGAANVRNPPILWKNNVLLAQKVVI